MKADCKFRFLVKGIQLLILKVDRDIHLLQFPDNSQNIHRVSGKAGEGLGDDEVDMSPLAGGDHLVELWPLFQAGA